MYFGYLSRITFLEVGDHSQVLKVLEGTCTFRSSGPLPGPQGVRRYMYGTAEVPTYYLSSCYRTAGAHRLQQGITKGGNIFPKAIGELGRCFGLWRQCPSKYVGDVGVAFHLLESTCKVDVYSTLLFFGILMYICIIVASTMKQFISANLDFFGFLNSFLCAIHCAAFPVLISFGLLESLFWIEHFWLEMTFHHVFWQASFSMFFDKSFVSRHPPPGRSGCPGMGWWGRAFIKIRLRAGRCCFCHVSFNLSCFNMFVRASCFTCKLDF